MRKRISPLQKYRRIAICPYPKPPLFTFILKLRVGGTVGVFAAVFHPKPTPTLLAQVYLLLYSTPSLLPPFPLRCRCDRHCYERTKEDESPHISVRFCLNKNRSNRAIFGFH